MEMIYFPTAFIQYISILFPYVFIYVLSVSPHQNISSMSARTLPVTFTPVKTVPGIVVSQLLDVLIVGRLNDP